MLHIKKKVIWVQNKITALTRNAVILKFWLIPNTVSFFILWLIANKKQILITFTFTFMHLADTFIQSDLHCIQVTVFTFYQLLLSLGIEPMILALLVPCATIWATGKPGQLNAILSQIKKDTLKTYTRSAFWHHNITYCMKTDIILWFAKDYI